MANEVSLQEFKVMMGVFNDAIAVVDTQSKRINGVLSDISGTFSSVAQDWQSPAASTFGDLAREYETDAANLNDLLADILVRMRQTYKNYHDVEVRAQQALRDQEPPPPPGRDRHTVVDQPEQLMRAQVMQATPGQAAPGQFTPAQVMRAELGQLMPAQVMPAEPTPTTPAR
ncbi:WXG100 family type VII secretion target [Micromonospora pisi]|uniref:WXG100 family type VII secretion target n=1 Tax=Micromonospora pisi TaxID=589240 RepID=A0A495JKG0_9ACTN|nr:WXG100 family type VII secretion target [Micromonospora pisi]RKR89413.1 WXG100 family type VII secretion target [Micromonospora pisi]